MSGDGITQTDRYIPTIRDMQAPKTGKEVSSLLGFLGYYREFIPAFARLTEGMNCLRNKCQLTADDLTPQIDKIEKFVSGAGWSCATFPNTIRSGRRW